MSYIKTEDLLAVLHSASPAKVDAIALNKRRVELGLLSVGLKIHCLNNGRAFDPLIERLGGHRRVLEINYYRKEKASLTWALPPVGSVRYAVMLLECIEQYTGEQLFNNREIQIQICNPGRLGNRDSGLLTLGFYLGSDVLRGYSLDDLETTFSESQRIPRGRRITIHDGEGGLDRDFEFWTYRKRRGRRRWQISCPLPFVYERTDVLTCTSRVDIYNVNLMATLLVHNANHWYWRELGGNFVRDMKEILEKHQLLDILNVPWIRQRAAGEYDDQLFVGAIREVMSYALSEHVRLNLKKVEGGILYEIRDLLARYRTELVMKAAVHEQRRPE